MEVLLFAWPEEELGAWEKRGKASLWLQLVECSSERNLRESEIAFDIVNDELKVVEFLASYLDHHNFCSHILFHEQERLLCSAGAI